MVKEHANVQKKPITITEKTSQVLPKVDNKIIENDKNTP